MAGAERRIGPPTRAYPVIEWRPPKLIAIHQESALLLAGIPPLHAISTSIKC